MRNTFNVNYYCRPSKVSKKDGMAHIELSIIINGKRILLNLPFRCRPEDFNRKRKPQEIEDYLNAQRTLISKVLAEMAENGIPVTSENLRDYYRTGGVKSYTAEVLFDEYLSILKARVPSTLTKGVYRKYELVRDLFFESFDKNREVTAINNAEVRRFFAFLDSKYDNSTAVGYKTKFKSFITFALDNNKLKINPFQGIKIVKEKKDIDYLRNDEIQALINTPIENESLSRVRDCAVFQLATGLSFADVCEIKKEDIQEQDGMFYISKNRVKTGTPYFSVVLPFGLEVFKKYDGKIPVISNQKYNLFLKSIQTLCGIKTTLHTHIFRHTYATLLLNKGVPMKTVSKTLGHANSKVTEYFYAHLEDKTILSQVKTALQ